MLKMGYFGDWHNENLESDEQQVSRLKDLTPKDPLPVVFPFKINMGGGKKKRDF